MSRVLEARGVTRTVIDGDRRVAIVEDVSLAVAAGERVALLGPSGSGKSTLLHIFGALDPEYDGSVEVTGQQLEGLSDARLAALRNARIGFVFQAYNLLGHISVLENVILPARFSRRSPERERAAMILDGIGLGDKLHRRPHTLSGGERQRVAIARAFYHRPSLVLCDEPTGNLDAKTGAEILKLFARLTEDGAGLLIATHDEMIARSADRVLHLRAGRLQ